MSRSPFKGRYDSLVDRESAYELLKKRAEEAQIKQMQAAELDKEQVRPARGRQKQSIGDAFMKSAARSIGNYVGRQIIRGVLGSIFGGKR